MDSTHCFRFLALRLLFRLRCVFLWWNLLGGRLTKYQFSDVERKWHTTCKRLAKNRGGSSNSGPRGSGLPMEDLESEPFPTVGAVCRGEATVGCFASFLGFSFGELVDEFVRELGGIGLAVPFRVTTMMLL